MDNATFHNIKTKKLPTVNKRRLVEWLMSEQPPLESENLLRQNHWICVGNGKAVTTNIDDMVIL